MLLREGRPFSHASTGCLGDISLNAEGQPAWNPFPVLPREQQVPVSTPYGQRSALPSLLQQETGTRISPEAEPTVPSECQSTHCLSALNQLTSSHVSLLPKINLRLGF